MDIHKRIVVHALLKIDRIKDQDPIPVFKHGHSAFTDHAAFRKRFVKTECAFYLQTFYEQLTSCLDGGFIRTWRRCECRF